MELTLATGVSIALLTATVLTHYELLRLASGLMVWNFCPTRARIMLVIGILFLAHMAEIGLYAAAFPSARTISGLASLPVISKAGFWTSSISRSPPTPRSVSETCTPVVRSD
jgi:hypothetical protein